MTLDGANGIPRVATNVDPSSHGMVFEHPPTKYVFALAAFKKRKVVFLPTRCPYLPLVGAAFNRITTSCSSISLFNRGGRNKLPEFPTTAHVVKLYRFDTSSPNASNHTLLVVSEVSPPLGFFNASAVNSRTRLGVHPDGPRLLRFFVLAVLL